MKAGTSNIETMQAHGLILKKHKISEGDQKLLNSLSASEVKALISVKNKLGEPFLRKIHKGGRFPHPNTSSF